MELMEPSIPEDLRTAEHHNEMWSAVETDDLPSVRRLINQWCRVDIAKGGVTLKDLALSRGTERIITLVLKMEPTLKLVNAVAENRLEDVKRLFEKHGAEIDVNFPNMRHSRATAVLFAIRHRHPALVAELLDRGARLDAPLVLPDQSELPLLFHVIRWDLPLDLLSQLLVRAIANKTEGQSVLDRMHYRDSWLLHWAVKAGLSADRLKLLLDFVTPGVLCARNQKNQTFFDMIRPQLRTQLVRHMQDTFDSAKTGFILDYIMRGFDMAWDIVPRNLLSAELLECATQLERHTYRFVCAVELGDWDAVQALTSFEFEPLGFKCCVANCRNLADGQPPLHKAVLNRDVKIVRHLCEVLLHGMAVRLDSVRDNFGRTALCYAFASAAEPTTHKTPASSAAAAAPTETDSQDQLATLSSTDTIVNLLLDHGSSEVALDWSDRTPQWFRETAAKLNRQGSGSGVSALLRFHRLGDYRKANVAEPDAVWIAASNKGCRSNGNGGGGGGGRGGRFDTCYSACCCSSRRAQQKFDGATRDDTEFDDEARQLNQRRHRQQHRRRDDDLSDCDSVDYDNSSEGDLEDSSNYTCRLL